MLHRTRQLVRQRTMLSNAIRGHMAELGIISAKGRNGTAELLQIIGNVADDRIPPVARFCLDLLAHQYLTLNAEVSSIDKRIHAWHRSCEASRRLEGIPGIGPIVATAMVAEIGDWGAFRSGRSLAAWIGLVPKQHSTGGKERQYHQTGQSLFAMATRRRCHGRHSLRASARHQPSLAHTTNGSPTC